MPPTILIFKRNPEKARSTNATGGDVLRAFFVFRHKTMAKTSKTEADSQNAGNSSTQVLDRPEATAEPQENNFLEIAKAHGAIPIDELKINQIRAEETNGKLPIGAFMEGERLRDLHLIPYTTEHDVVLSHARNNEDIHVSLGRFLPTIIKDIGGQAIADLAKAKGCTPAKFIERLTLADALAILINIRLATVGGEVALTDQCPACRTVNEDTKESGFHDLGGVEVGTVMNKITGELKVAVELEDGFEEAGYHVKTIIMRPMRLFQSADEQLKKASNERADLLMLYKMICALPEVIEYEGVTSGIFNDETYGKLSLRDRDKLNQATAKIMKIGPRMIIEMECEACSRKWSTMLPWRFLKQFLSESAHTTSSK